MLSCALFALLCTTVGSEEGDDPGSWMEGHSLHGETFNEGPRQAAYLMGNGVSTPFKVTTSVPLAQVFFDQGVCQLHGFWYLEAERSFRQVARLDPDCAMAYWGMCVAADTQDDERSAGFAREAWLRREHASEREQQYIDMWARYHAVEYPAYDGKNPEYEAQKKARDEARKDREKQREKKRAAAQEDPGAADEPAPEVEETPLVERFEAGSPEFEQARRAHEEKKLSERKKADDKARSAQLVKDYEKLIYDHPDDIEARAFLANRLWLNTRRGHSITSKMANQALLDQVFAVNPMHPAHHYRIHLWDTKEEAYRVVNSAARCGQSAPGIAHMWHMSGHIFSRLERYHDAVWQQEASARTDHRQMFENRLLPDQIHNFAHNNEWLCRNLLFIGRVDDAISLARNSIELPRHPTYNTLDKRGSANYGRRRLLEALQKYELWDDLIETCNTMYLEPSEESDDEALRSSLLGSAWIAKGDGDRARQQVTRLQEMLDLAKVERNEKVLEAEGKALNEDKKEDEVQKAMADAMKQHSSNVRDIQKKIDTLEARIALHEKDEPEAALKKLADLKYDELELSRLYLAAGDASEAKKLAKEATKNATMQALPWANYAWILHQTEGADKAAEAFETLRAFSSRFDLDKPPFARLDGLVAELGLDTDWRIEHVVADDVGVRPPLDQLGPYRWSPPPAEDWSLVDAYDQVRSMKDYSGRAVLVVFFLGFGCVHCVEQLQALEPVADDFQRRGIDIVAIGTDTLAQMRDSMGDDPTRTGYSFPILADPQLEVFKRWRCHDDFEELALHGTFLVDGDGAVRWQDISYEPFTDMDFLLDESERLLGLPKPGQSFAVRDTELELSTGSTGGGGSRP